MAYMDAAWWRREYEDLVHLRNKAERERDEARSVARQLLQEGRRQSGPEHDGWCNWFAERSDWLEEADEQ